MKKAWLYTIALIAVFGLILTGCEKSNNPLTNDLEGPDTHTAGCPLSVDLILGQNIYGGIVQTWNDDNYLYVRFVTSGNWYLTESHVGAYNDPELIPNWPNRPQGGQLMSKHDPIDPPSQTDLHMIPLTWPTDTKLWVVAHCSAFLDEDNDGEYDEGEQSETGFGGNIVGGGPAWWRYYNYWTQDDHQEEDGFRTQTQGGWGAPPHGENPGAYLHANFAGAFPSGLVVGDIYTLTLTTAQAITDFLPQGGKPQALTMSYTNPTEKITVLAGQVIALKLSVEFDLYDEEFGESETNLKDLEVAFGTFAGWTVEEVLEEAETILGGGSSSYTPAEINECVSAINENFVDGEVNLGFLIEPTP